MIDYNSVFDLAEEKDKLIVKRLGEWKDHETLKKIKTKIATRDLETKDFALAVDEHT